MKKQNLVLAVLSVLFLAAGIFFAYRVNQPIPSEGQAKKIQNNLTDVLADVNRQADNQLKRLSQGKTIASSETQFLLIDDVKILQWTDNHFIPSYYVVAGDYDVKYVRLTSGDFIVRQFSVDSTRSLVAVIPLHVQYRITNDYLKPYWHPKIFDNSNVVILLPELDQGFPVTVDNKVIFKVSPFGSTALSPLARNLSVLFVSLTLILLVILITRWVKGVSVQRPFAGFLLLGALLISVRALMLAFRFPARFGRLMLFDPKDFASSQLNPSLGDMLINAILIFFLCFYLFRNYKRFKFFSHTPNWIVTVFGAVSVFFAILYPSIVIQTLYNNSAITLSISQSLTFDVVRVGAFLVLVISWISAFLFAHVAIRLLTVNDNLKQITVSVFIGFFVFLGLNEFTGQPYAEAAFVAIVFLIGVVAFRIYLSLDRFQYATFVYFFFAVLCFSVAGVFAVRNFENHRKAENQQRFAENFLVDRDYFGEYLMQETARKIEQDIFIQTRLTNPLVGKEAIKHKIQQVSLSGYFNRYNVLISLYDQTGDPLPDETDTTNFYTLVKRYDQKKFSTDYRNVFYITDREDRTLKKYIMLVPIRKGQAVVGNVLVELALKRIIPENVYPELLVDTRFQQAYRPRDQSYAIISSSQVEYSAGNFNYEPLIEAELANVDLYSEGIFRDGYLHVGVEDVSGRLAIVSSPAAPFMYRLADFSFLVLLGIGAVFIFLLIEGIVHYSGSANLFFSARIQLILNLAFFVPLVAVCLITLGLTAKSSRKELQDDFLNKAAQFGKTLSITIQDVGSTRGEEFENEFKNVTLLANLDANLYANDGTLITTSQPLIFENQLLAPYLDPGVYRRMKRGEASFVGTDHVGSLEFYVAYSKVLAPETGEVLGILGIPFFQSGASIEQMQITVLANIISIFTLVFIVLLIISFFVTKWLTAPLSMITQTLGRISLTKTNEPLEWNSDDEIGLMVREYNHMLDTLSASKQELEKNQREKAWREIAQQVAHEIKNPLTPMKLTLQQLERSLQHDEGNEKLKRAVLSLLSQVNSLDELASSFSSFAKMPEPVMKPIELVSLVNRVINLHANESEIMLRSEVTEAPVLADEQLLGRILSNIILNGIQAVPKGRQAKIVVTITHRSPYFSIAISDNGSGIDPELKDKVFLPHFTTKKTGSGLGLAIARQGIEQMGGRISFSTSVEGTTFQINLPKNS
ncbi:MAG TPA: ATP-binding protein [Cyclobacteriaceae bacterium]|nr:HAMP domain-containing protein [Cyclobacteriaceae bacterium]HMV10624.1 ATP-binding protein [Cyclobacteriaceae bacterium]HMV91018.1 ATP-binding protein [Cyclobacteriaceae bacterium]HMX02611.1 ATP-binding protein [Cyclobacteriaceae bacterium]HMX50890.1 ATP-binding protein [Cyclobacteriaceae bacterium]